MRTNFRRGKGNCKEDSQATLPHVSRLNFKVKKMHSFKKWRVSRTQFSDAWAETLPTELSATISTPLHVGNLTLSELSASRQVIALVAENKRFANSEKNRPLPQAQNEFRHCRFRGTLRANDGGNSIKPGRFAWAAQQNDIEPGKLISLGRPPAPFWPIRPAMRAWEKFVSYRDVENYRSCSNSLRCLAPW